MTRRNILVFIDLRVTQTIFYMQTFRSSLKVLDNSFEIDDWIGLLVSVFIIGLWFVSLISSIAISVPNSDYLWLSCLVLVRTYLHTGLFIVAHDAMHGNLIPHSPRLNHLIGCFAVRVYGSLPYHHCRINHGDHHRYTSQSGDPDFHGQISHPVFWYCKFISEYFPLRSLIIFFVNLSLIFWGAIFLLHVPFTNLILFWMIPFLLSSLQLFFFGTYLPHRQIHNNLNFLPRTHSDRYSVLWSFLSCYNFGHYHWEHHEYPKTPWYRLHNIHQ